jgi:hypothetical protein
VVGEFKRLSVSRRWLDGHVGRILRSNRVERLICRTVFMVFMMVAGIASSALVSASPGSAQFEQPPRKFPVTILSSPDHATVSWQVRSQGRVRLRLYRTLPNGREDLVGEVSAAKGLTSFEMSDDARPPGPTVYQVRAVRRNGSEETLGSVLCIESEFSPKAVTPPWDVSQLVADATGDFGFCQSADGLIRADDSPRKWRVERGPEPPVPRRGSVGA